MRRALTILVIFVTFTGNTLFVYGQNDDPWSFELSAGATLPFSFDNYYVQNSEENRQLNSRISGSLAFKVLWTKRATLFLESGFTGLNYETRDQPPAALISPGRERYRVNRHALIMPVQIGWYPKIKLAEQRSVYLAPSLGCIVSFLGRIESETLYPSSPNRNTFEVDRGLQSLVIHPISSLEIGYTFTLANSNSIGVGFKLAHFPFMKPRLSFCELRAFYQLR